MATNWTGLLGWLFGRPDPAELAMLRDPSAAVRQGLTRARQAASQGLVNVAEGRAPFNTSIDPVHAARNAPQGFARGLLQGAQGAYEALPAWAAPGKLLNQTAPPMADTLLPIPGQVRQNPSAMSGVNAGQAAGNLAFELSPLADIRDAQQAAELAREHPLEAGLMVGAAAIPFAPELMKGARAGVNAVVSPRVGRSGMAGVLTFHGTPHTWAPEPGFPHGRPRYDATTAHTGEGSNAFGAGFYSAENPSVASVYRRDYSGPGTLYDGERAIPYPDQMMDTVEDQAVWYAQAYDGLPGARDQIRKAVEQMERLADDTITGRRMKPRLELLRKTEELLNKPGVRFEKGGNLYELDIPDELVPKYLEWDKPLSEQSPEVREAFKAMGSRAGDESLGVYLKRAESNPMYAGDLIGRDRASKAEVYEALRKAGIPGIRFLDRGSRGAGQGTYNYVTFAPQDIVKQVRRLGDTQ